MLASVLTGGVARGDHLRRSGRIGEDAEKQGQPRQGRHSVAGGSRPRLRCVAPSDLKNSSTPGRTRWPGVLEKDSTRPVPLAGDRPHKSPPASYWFALVDFA